MSALSSNGMLVRLRQRLSAADTWPYLLGLIVLVALVSGCEPLWLTNDDVHMSLLSEGEGITTVPNPHLVLTNIAWGYLVYWFPDIGGIRSYTWVTYVAFGLAYAGTWLGFRRSEVDHRVAALLMLLVYVPALVEPQFTLVAGYLAAAGLLLACTAIRVRSLPLAAFAGALVVLSTLVRIDETVLVLLVSAPLCIAALRTAWDSDLRSRWLAIAGATAALLAGFWFMDYLSFSAEPWTYFASGYALRDGFTDFSFGTWFTSHPTSLEGSGFSVNDLHLLKAWFSLDPQVYSPERMQALLQHLPWEGRLHLDVESFVEALTPFSLPLVMAASAVLACTLLLHQRRLPLIMTLALFAALMVALCIAGRPGVSRIYVPVFVAIALLAITQLGRFKPRLDGAMLVVLIIATVLTCEHTYIRDRNIRHAIADVQAATCSLPRGRLIVTWGGTYPFPVEYPVFQTKQETCPFDYYSFGQFSLAPFALDQLHRYTGGKDFVPAILAGQTFEIVAERPLLVWLRTYFNAHYGVKLSIKPLFSNDRFEIFTVALKAPAAVR
jgi:hypothetical protein